MTNGVCVFNLNNNSFNRCNMTNGVCVCVFNLNNNSFNR